MKKIIEGVKKVHFKRGDVVKVLTGDDTGKTGKVLQVFPTKGRAIVEGINYVKKHLRKSQDNPKGGIVQKEASMHVSNLKVVTEGDARKGGKSAKADVGAKSGE